MGKRTLDEIIDHFQSSCCGESLYRKGSMEYRCKKCEINNTQELFYALKKVL